MEDILALVAQYAALVAGIGLIVKWIINAAKESFLPGQYARLTALTLGALLGLAYSFSVEELTPIIGAIIGIFGGATAIGDYDGSQDLTIKRLQEPVFESRPLTDSPEDHTEPAPTSEPDGDKL